MHSIKILLVGYLKIVSFYDLNLFLFFNGYERETLISCVQYMPPLGIKTATQVCALNGIKPATFWCTIQCSKQLSHTCQGLNLFLGTTVLCISSE